MKYSKINVKYTNIKYRMSGNDEEQNIINDETPRESYYKHKRVQITANEYKKN